VSDSESDDCGIRRRIFLVAGNEAMKQKRSQRLGVLIAIVSSCVGGTAAAVTRYLAGSADPLTLAIL